jgi:hypothetical protein
MGGCGFWRFFLFDQGECLLFVDGSLEGGVAFWAEVLFVAGVIGKKEGQGVKVLFSD